MTATLNYADWKADNRPILEGLPGKNLIMTFSGGKDGSIILHYLDRARAEFGFTFETVGAQFPHHVFPDHEVERLSDYWHSRGIDIHWILPDMPDDALTEAERSGGSACRLCQKKKRGLLGSYLKSKERGGSEVVVILSFNLWDIVTYTVEHLLGGVYRPDGMSRTSNDMISDDRFIVTSHRFYRFLELKDGFSLFKPLIRYNEHEIVEAVEREKILYSDLPCDFKNTRTKRVLFEYYRQMNLSFDYDKVLRFYEKTLRSHDMSYYTGLAKEDLIKVL